MREKQGYFDFYVVVEAYIKIFVFWVFYMNIVGFSSLFPHTLIFLSSS